MGKLKVKMSAKDFNTVLVLFAFEDFSKEMDLSIIPSDGAERFESFDNYITNKYGDNWGNLFKNMIQSKTESFLKEWKPVENKGNEDEKV